MEANAFILGKKNNEVVLFFIFLVVRFFLLLNHIEIIRYLIKKIIQTIGANLHPPRVHQKSSVYLKKFREPVSL